MKLKTTFTSRMAAREHLKKRGWAYVHTTKGVDLFMHTRIHGYWREIYQDRPGVWKTRPL